METDRANLRLWFAPEPTLIPISSRDRPVLRSPCTRVPHAIERLNAVRLLSLDAHGRVLDWMSWQDAACLYVRGAVAWTLGDPCLHVHGGTCRATGEQSLIELHPIVAARGHARAACARSHAGADQRRAVRARRSTCACTAATTTTRPHLTRDHVMPVSKGGRDIWENVVSACFHCNSRKGSRTPQQAGMPLLAVPYRPSWVEHLILSQPQHPGRPDGVPENAAAEERACRLTASVRCALTRRRASQHSGLSCTGFANDGIDARHHRHGFRHRGGTARRLPAGQRDARAAAGSSLPEARPTTSWSTWTACTAR